MNYESGMNRVMEPEHVIPIMAWSLDPKREINDYEVRISVKRIHFEAGSFKQICEECGYEEEKIREKILSIVQKRGKLHNPATNTGGILYGAVEEVGKQYQNKRSISVGDHVISVISLMAIPMLLTSVGKIDYRYGQAQVEGYGILYGSAAMVKCPKGLGLETLMVVLNESGSLLGAQSLVQDQKRILILGNDLLLSLLYSFVVRKEKPDCFIAVLLDQESLDYLEKDEIRSILGTYVNQVYLQELLPSALSPTDIYADVMKKERELFDFCINSSNLRGAEAVSVLLTRERGTLFFGSLSNNYNLAVVYAEALGKELRVHSIGEYICDYPPFAQRKLLEIRQELDRVHELYNRIPLRLKANKSTIDCLKHESIRETDGFVYMSRVSRCLVEETLNIAKYDCNVIIEGETGVGKERILNLIQKNCSRRDQPCIRINCATIQENLAESEFFGYEAGAFTGANAEGKKGYFELANHGILFLDEVGALSLPLQSKLLRVLQENQFYRIGGTRQIDVDVRVICANNLRLRQLVKEGKFREDLFYRFNICEIMIPPLRERRPDIFCLSCSFLKRFNEKYKMEKTIEDQGYLQLYNHFWKGNVRELENVIHRAVINTRGNVITALEIDGYLHHNASDFRELLDSTSVNNRLPLEDAVGVVERRMITRALSETSNTRDAARALGISQSQLLRKKRKYEIE